MQIKTTLIYIFLPRKIAEIQKLDNAQLVRLCGNRHPYLSDGSPEWYTRMQGLWAVFTKFTRIYA